MTIYLLDRSESVTAAWRRSFCDCEDVAVICGDFAEFMDRNNVDCVVSPANSYGLMDGGYDLAITRYFGPELQKQVQKYILQNYCGEQPVGTAFLINIPGSDKKLIHTPTMRVPSPIRDPIVVYQCMRVTLMLAKEHQIGRIVIPAFGRLTGRLPAELVADLMRAGYDQVYHPPKALDWDYARSHKPEQLC